MHNLRLLLSENAEQHGDRTAIREVLGARSINYRDLNALSEAIAKKLSRAEVLAGQRVVLWGGRSIEMVAALFACLKLGAVYVPVDAGTPYNRVRRVWEDAGAQVLIAEHCMLSGGTEALDKEHGPAFDLPGKRMCLYRLRNIGGCEPLNGADLVGAPPSGSEPACMLYTSGSTGDPKGVLYSCENIMTFVNWAAKQVEVTSSDNFASLSPLSFDLSVFDFFVSLGNGACVSIFEHPLLKQPAHLAEQAAARITVWYSTPSLLRLLLAFGTLQQLKWPGLRFVAFAGETFSQADWSVLAEHWGDASFMNLYGPTETNVCSAYKIVPGKLPSGTDFPIGQACAGNKVRQVKVDNGFELQVSGPTVMMGYWRSPALNKQAFVQQGDCWWYRTGDLVDPKDEAELRFLGRTDRMVKRQGCRVELGDLESAISQVPGIFESAAISQGSGSDRVSVTAFVAFQNEPLTGGQIRERLRTELPVYMLPDQIEILPLLPRTHSGKVNYGRLRTLAEAF